MVGAVSILPMTLTGAEVVRRGKRLLGPIDIEIGTRGCTVVMGPNGAGKTTLLRAMHGLERLSEGNKRWAVPEPQSRSAQAFVFQSPVMLRRNVIENLIYPLVIHGVTRKAALETAQGWLDRVGLGDAAKRRAAVLSGGERQKLALVRALIREPQVLFLDEPCANLDGAATREIEEILHTAKSGGIRILMATHDIGQARRLADDVLFIHHGRLHESGNVQTFFNQPQTPEAMAFLKGDIVE